MRIRIERTSPHLKTISVKDSNQTLISLIEVSKVDLWTYSLKVPQIQAQPFLLKKRASRERLSQEACFNHEGSWAILFCFTDDRFYFEAQSESSQTRHSIYGSLAVQDPSPLEAPISISLDDAIARAMAFNFDSRENFEKALQARHQATAAYLNLLPHLNVNILWYTSVSFTAIPLLMLNVAPFLLPTSWLNARQSSLEAKVQQKALTIFKGDLIATLESLFYEYNRTERILQKCQSFLKIAQEMRFNLGPEKVDTKGLDQIVKSIQDTQEEVNWAREKTRYALSLALGFMNPEAIQSIVISNPVFPEASFELDGKLLGQEAVRRSIELSQLNLAIMAQKTRKPWLYLNWMDPAGDSRSALGLALFSQAKIIKGELEELKIKKEEVQATLFNRAYETTLNLNRSAHFYLKTKNREKLTKRQFRSSLNSLRAPILIPLSPQWIATRSQFRTRPSAESIRHHLQEWIAASLEAEDHLRNFRLEQAKVNRLSLAGPYASLLF